jgi:predicted TIM-barrel fold metal-dependent hydrolase
VVDYTAQMQAAYAAWLARDAERFPRLPVVFAILAGGAPFQLERLRSRGGEPRAAVPPNALFDTASYGPRALRFCLETVGAGQLVFGSDAPVIEPGPTLEAVRGLGPAAAPLILRENLGRLLAG